MGWREVGVGERLDVREAQVIGGASFGVFVRDEQHQVGLVPVTKLGRAYIEHPLIDFPIGTSMLVVVDRPIEPTPYEEVIYAYVGMRCVTLAESMGFEE